VTPNQALTLMDVDPVTGSTAGGVLQTAQRIGLAVGQAVVGAVYFASLHGARSHGAHGHALRSAVLAALAFVVVATAVGMADLVADRRRRAPADRVSLSPPS
jgi:hypothetical protein